MLMTMKKVKMQIQILSDCKNWSIMKQRSLILNKLKSH